ncbi:DUF948 domain-containing protein [Candidatus Hakubella thermalkaliphila]|uniref:DUF948 domain-containing protein n=1 Tax=Candidatus Hakubella thermalkaliphila TaxID=2754717 RepID=A0A6V8PF58_9ACTN|nr:DUF948 domain-containing protein [Candidatus Hakubella thermalkaliphila]GFP31349.1 hypothetical protein HKBW3S34_02269 [Candidatus Hakubella thermalkaliphila]GFP38851.1 hypothetical protein HKBW3S47_00551 [Candidatus Hakubella thermalkaliphila]
MGTIEIFQIVFSVSAAIFVVIFIPVAIQLFRTLRSIQRFIKDLNVEIIPILGRVQTTVEEVNEGLSTVGDILTSLRDVSERVEKTAKTAQQALASPLVKMAGLSVSAVKFLSFLRKLRKKNSRK